MRIRIWDLFRPWIRDAKLRIRDKSGANVTNKKEKKVKKVLFSLFTTGARYVLSLQVRNTIGTRDNSYIQQLVQYRCLQCLQYHSLKYREVTVVVIKHTKNTGTVWHIQQENLQNLENLHQYRIPQLQR
jgi:hypothetical protein